MTIRFRSEGKIGSFYGVYSRVTVEERFPIPVTKLRGRLPETTLPQVSVLNSNQTA